MTTHCRDSVQLQNSGEERNNKVSMMSVSWSRYLLLLTFQYFIDYNAIKYHSAREIIFLLFIQPYSGTVIIYSDAMESLVNWQPLLDS